MAGVTGKVTELPEDIVVHTTRHVERDVADAPAARAAGPDLRRVDYPPPSTAGSSSDGFLKFMLVLAAILAILAFGNYLYQSNRSLIAGFLFGPPASTERYSEVPKTEDRAVADASVRLAAASPATARPNPIKEKYLADCKAEGADIMEGADGVLRCVRPSSVTHNAGRVVPTLQNAKTRDEFEKACAAAKGKYWIDASNKPRCTQS